MEFGKQVTLSEEDRRALAPPTDLAMITPSPEMVAQYPAVWGLNDLADLRACVESQLITKDLQLEGIKRARNRHNNTAAVFQLRRDINVLQLALQGIFDYSSQQHATAPPRD